VVPSRQRAYAARLAFAAARLGSGARVWATPDVLTPDAWLIRELEQLAAVPGARLPRLLSPAEEWLLWRQCTADATGDLQLLNRGALAESLRRASTLAAEYAIDLSKLSMLGAEAELFARIQQAVDERCRALGAATTQTLVSQMAVTAREGGASTATAAGAGAAAGVGEGAGSSPAAWPSVGPPGGRTGVTCAGFLKLAPRLEALGAKHRRAGPALARPTASVLADESDELESIAQWCRRRIAMQANTRLLVILAGSAGARERLATLIRQAVDPEGWLSPGSSSRIDNLVAIEGGTALADIPAVAHALLTLKWLGGSVGEFEEVSEWLRAPYWDSPSATARARIDLWLRESGHLSLNGHKWRSILATAPAPISRGAQELAHQVNAAIDTLGVDTASPREWSERFRAALDAVHWPGERVRDSSEQQTVVRLHELLDEFGQLALSARVMSRDEAIHWFGELAARTAFRPADDDAVVTISAAMADPIVLYDGIWVAGLHAEAFPQPVQPDPFLPLAAQIAAGMPAASASGRLAEARALMGAWRAATRELVLSTPARAEDLELLPSPLLAEWLDIASDGSEEGQAASAKSTRRVSRKSVQMELALEAALATNGLAVTDTLPQPATPARSSAWLPHVMHRPNMIEYFEDSMGVAWPIGQLLPSGTRSLELQNLCAFRAYSELRLGSSELGVPEPGVAPDIRGQLLHSALQHLWSELRDSETLSRHGDVTLDALIERSVNKAAAAILGAQAGSERAPVFARECRRTARLIKKLCALERSRHQFQVQDTEFEKTLSVAGAQMRVRIDRLDALKAGGRAILDYKSGRRTTADWYGERPSHPQLLAYLAAIGEGVVAMATVNVNAREVRFDGIANSGQLLPKVKGVEPPVGAASGDAWEVRTQEWRACIERLANAFLAGRAVLDPKPGACDYCHAVSVCRISDGGIDVAAELLTAEFDGVAR
jgi:RecB family exonuclease